LFSRKKNRRRIIDGTVSGENRGRHWENEALYDGRLGERGYKGSNEEIEEERRLLYVAMMRSRRADAGRPATRFYVHGQPRNADRHVLAIRARFIPPMLLKHFERVAWPPPQAGASPVAREGPAVDLAARMRAMWR